VHRGSDRTLEKVERQIVLWTPTDNQQHTQLREKSARPIEQIQMVWSFLVQLDITRSAHHAAHWRQGLCFPHLQTGLQSNCAHRAQ
jgi:hypothetical protein